MSNRCQSWSYTSELEHSMSHHPQEGLLRLKDIIGDRRSSPPTAALLPIAPSTWWELVRAGEAPKPLKIGRASVWRAKDIHALIERISREGAITLPRRTRRCAAEPAKAA
jgi:predicted DNA-binding transcriptional regulator AlpA